MRDAPRGCCRRCAPRSRCRCSRSPSRMKSTPSKSQIRAGSQPPSAAATMARRWTRPLDGFEVIAEEDVLLVGMKSRAPCRAWRASPAWVGLDDVAIDASRSAVHEVHVSSPMMTANRVFHCAPSRDCSERELTGSRE